MLILRLWNYLRGYVIILIEGYFPEKFINICINRGIFLWDINREKSCVITLKIGVNAFRKLRPIVKKTRCRLEIRAKRGLPFTFYKYRRRKTFLVGCLLFICMVYFLSSFIWTVEIYGNKKMSAQEIVDNLAKNGLKPGIWKPVINTNRVCNKMMIQVNKLAWISIDITGTKAIVEVSERVMPPQIIDKNMPCNIIATKDGVVTSLIIREGSPMVKVGDTVKKGDLLVAGMVESKDKIIRYVHAMAEVNARTWYEEAVNVPLKRKQMKQTGTTKTKYSIKIFNKYICLGYNKSPFAMFELKQDLKLISLGKNNELPFGLLIDTYNEKKLFNEKITPANAKKEAIKKVNDIINKKIQKSIQIKEKKLYTAEGKNAIRARLLVECLEQIGTEEKIIY